jgi:hypothetical protein
MTFLPNELYAPTPADRVSRMVSVQNSMTFAVLVPINQPHSFFYESMDSIIYDVPTTTPIYCILHKPTELLKIFIEEYHQVDRLVILISNSENLSGCLNEGLELIPESTRM